MECSPECPQQRGVAQNRSYPTILLLGTNNVQQHMGSPSLVAFCTLLAWLGFASFVVVGHPSIELREPLGVLVRKLLEDMPRTPCRAFLWPLTRWFSLPSVASLH